MDKPVPLLQRQELSSLFSREKDGKWKGGGKVSQLVFTFDTNNFFLVLSFILSKKKYVSSVELKNSSYFLFLPCLKGEGERQRERAKFPRPSNASVISGDGMKWPQNEILFGRNIRSNVLLSPFFVRKEGRKRKSRTSDTSTCKSSHIISSSFHCSLLLYSSSKGREKESRRIFYTRGKVDKK